MSPLRIVFAAMAVPPSATMRARMIATINAGDGRRLSLDFTVPPSAAQPNTRRPVPGEIRSLGQLLAEALGSSPQRELRVHSQAAGHVHELEQGLADPALGGLPGLIVAESLLSLLARQPGRDGPPLHLAGVEQRREVLRHVGERVVRSPALLLALDAVPVAQDLARGFGLRLTEHVRVAADELQDHRVDAVGQAAGPAPLDEERKEVGLEEHVAQ